jgi:hypothetical protein
MFCFMPLLLFSIAFLSRKNPGEGPTTIEGKEEGGLGAKGFRASTFHTAEKIVAILPLEGILKGSSRSPRL